MGEKRIHDEHADDEAHGRLREADHPTPVDRVGERPSDERRDEQGDQLRQAEQTHDERRMADLERLIRERDVGHHAPEERHALTYEEKAELSRAAQRRQVDPEQAHAEQSGRRPWRPPLSHP